MIIHQLRLECGYELMDQFIIIDPYSIHPGPLYVQEALQSSIPPDPVYQCHLFFISSPFPFPTTASIPSPSDLPCSNLSATARKNSLYSPSPRPIPNLPPVSFLNRSSSLSTLQCVFPHHPRIEIPLPPPYQPLSPFPEPSKTEPHQPATPPS
jgi:hypothetical protein